jgi:hypothetical protein
MHSGLNKCEVGFKASNTSHFGEAIKTKNVKSLIYVLVEVLGKKITIYSICAIALGGLWFFSKGQL